jgi:hypothetical protein
MHVNPFELGLAQGLLLLHLQGPRQVLPLQRNEISPARIYRVSQSDIESAAATACGILALNARDGDQPLATFVLNFRHQLPNRPIPLFLEPSLPQDRMHPRNEGRASAVLRIKHAFLCCREPLVRDGPRGDRPPSATRCHGMGTPITQRPAGDSLFQIWLCVTGQPNTLLLVVV